MEALRSRSVLGLGLALLLAGIAFDAGLLYLPGVALACLALVLPLLVHLSASGVRLERGRLPTRVVEDEPIEVSYRFRVGLAPLLAKLSDPLLAEALRIGALRPLAWRGLSTEARLRGRGRHRLEPARLSISAPLGLASREVVTGGGATILVLPRIEPLLGPGGEHGASAGHLLAGAADLVARGSLRESPLEPELDGVRPYRPGTPASRIYWPAFARGGELVERKLTGGGTSAPLVALECPVGIDGPQLERAVRAAASICRHLAALGPCELILPGQGRPARVGSEGASWSHAHARLALVETGSGAPVLREVGPEAPLFWVSAGVPSQARPGYLVTPEPIPRLPVAFTVAGCRAHRVGRIAREPAATIA